MAEELKRYQIPHFSGPKTPNEQLEEAKNTPAHVLYFDKKFERSREILIFIEETKIWQDLLQDCVDRAGVGASKACKALYDMVEERNKYYNSNFNAAMRPQITPGIPPYYERIIRE